MCINNDNTTTLIEKCRVCEKEQSIGVDTNKLNTYRQNIASGGSKAVLPYMFPELSSDDRNFFFEDNICDDCWDKEWDEYLKKVRKEG